MAYLALYRKYRPVDFKGVIGQDHIVRTLVNQITANRLGHAYLFTGTRGTGKTSLAKIFAKAINCLNNIDGSPCGQCEACKALADPSNIDVLEIDAASNNGVNEIRDLREKVQYPPVSCRYKVYIIDEVHMLTGAAFNALLKTIEEPPKHVVFILATTEAHKIPATILSRCMRFDFRLVPTDMIAEHICKIYDEQGKKYEKEAVNAIAKAGEGSVRDALSIADTALSYSDNVLKYDDVMDILGSSNQEFLYAFTASLLNGQSGEVLKHIEDLCSLGKSMGVLTKDVTEVLRNLLIVKTCESGNAILGLPATKYETLENIAKNTNKDRLLRALEIFASVENELKYTVHPRIVFETAAIKACKPEADYDIEALMARIKTLEDKLEKGEFTVKTNANIISSVVEKEKPKALENTPSAPVEINEKSYINGIPAQEIRGRLLVELKKASPMTWNIMQKVNLSVNGNVMTLNVENEDDLNLLSKDVIKQKIIEALSMFEPFQIEVKLQDSKIISEIDTATERMKKLFGSDIVIIKD